MFYNKLILITENLGGINSSDLEESSQTLHADESGTITLSNYSGDQTLTAVSLFSHFDKVNFVTCDMWNSHNEKFYQQESIRDLEETLNQQLFSVGVNLTLSNNITQDLSDSNAEISDSGREHPVLNIIYENTKSLETASNLNIDSTVYTQPFDTFDMSQITLQVSIIYIFNCLF